MKKAFRRHSVWCLCILALVALGLGGCAKKPAPAPSGAETTGVTEMDSREVRGIDEGQMSESAVGEAGSAAADSAAAAAEYALQPVFFEFDQYTLTPQARQTLEQNAAYLKDHPGFEVRVEGHCDERGSDEYNLALGERRAQAAESYLVTLGVDPGRLATVSYGEERPLDRRNTEEAWARNRRVEFSVAR